MLQCGGERARSLMEKAPGFEPGDWGFDSLRARQKKERLMRPFG